MSRLIDCEETGDSGGAEHSLSAMFSPLGVSPLTPACRPNRNPDGRLASKTKPYYRQDGQKSIATRNAGILSASSPRPLAPSAHSKRAALLFRTALE